MRNHTLYASATPVVAGSAPVVRSYPLLASTFYEKRFRSQGDPNHDIQSIHGVRALLPKGFVFSQEVFDIGILATSPDASTDPHDNVVSGVLPRETGGLLAHRAASVVFEVPMKG